MMAGGCCDGGVHDCCAGWWCGSCLLGCPFDSAWCLVSELCRMTVVWVDYRCSLSFLFLGGARRLELSPCNNIVCLLQAAPQRRDSASRTCLHATRVYALWMS